MQKQIVKKYLKYKYKLDKLQNGGTYELPNNIKFLNIAFQTITQCVLYKNDPIFKQLIDNNEVDKYVNYEYHTFEYILNNYNINLFKLPKLTSGQLYYINYGNLTKPITNIIIVFGKYYIIENLEDDINLLKKKSMPPQAEEFKYGFFFDFSGKINYNILTYPINYLETKRIPKLTLEDITHDITEIKNEILKIKKLIKTAKGDELDDLEDLETTKENEILRYKSIHSRILTNLFLGNDLKKKILEHLDSINLLQIIKKINSKNNILLKHLLKSEQMTENIKLIYTKFQSSENFIDVLNSIKNIGGYNCDKLFAHNYNSDIKILNRFDILFTNIERECDCTYMKNCNGLKPILKHDNEELIKSITYYVHNTQDIAETIINKYIEIINEQYNLNASKFLTDEMAKTLILKVRETYEDANETDSMEVLYRGIKYDVNTDYINEGIFFNKYPFSTTSNINTALNYSTQARIIRIFLQKDTKFLDMSTISKNKYECEVIFPDGTLLYIFSYSPELIHNGIEFIEVYFYNAVLVGVFKDLQIPL